MPAAVFAAQIVAENDAPAPPIVATPSPWRIQRPGSMASSEERIDSILTILTILTILAHEIRTPLTVVSGYASILEATPDAEEAKPALAIGRAADRINRILANMMDLITEGSGAGGPELAVVDAVTATRGIIGDEPASAVVAFHAPDDAEAILINVDTGKFPRR